ncbi:MAG: glutamate--tRNA ligase [Ardenticatenia bacterium]|nr:glutamate--tRNA ligase [Ardenticatenia bacterium]
MAAQVRVRFAPSPTGYLHVGGARTALFNWLWARHTGGTFILRVEDTDRKRYVPDSLEDIQESLRWLGITWDEGPGVGGPYGPYFQSERLALYHRYAEELVNRGAAYRCYCSPERLARVRQERQRRGEPPGYDRRCRYLSAEERARLEAEGLASVVRLKVPERGTTVVRDLLRGEIAFENATLEDVVLLKSDGYPTYHLAVVVDDHLMEISHVMRADEWISSFPLHALIYRALEWELPTFVHLPMILDPSGTGKLSKRKQKRADGQVADNMTTVREFREAGYLPEALFNFIATLGWAYSGTQEIFSVDEAIARFELEDIRKAPAVFSYEKLEWMNGVYIRALAPEELARRLVPFMAKAGIEVEAEALLPLIPLVQERLKTLADGPSYLDFFFQEVEVPPPALFIHKKMDLERTVRALGAAREVLAQVVWEEEAIETHLRQLAKALGLKPGHLFQPIRVATTGKRVAPPLFGTLYHLGRERVLARVDRAIAALKRALARQE